jgi:Dual OB-containing domain
MQIVVNHLTRMKAPRICIAGIDPETRRHIRPTTPPSDPIERTLLDAEGGPFGIGVLADLGEVRANPSPPECEDHLFSTASATAVGQYDADQYLELLDEVAEDDLESIFGTDLERPRGRSFAIEEGHGTVSLGVLRVQQRPDLEVDSSGKVKLTYNDVDHPPSLGVTDVRFVEPDQKTPRFDVVEDVQRRIQLGVNLYLMVGLARAYVAPGDDRDRHWLQVNGICLEDRPVGHIP